MCLLGCTNRRLRTYALEQYKYMCNLITNEVFVYKKNYVLMNDLCFKLNYIASVYIDEEGKTLCKHGYC